jgi:glutaredoxin 3
MSQKKPVTVYTMDYCHYCERAKALLKQRGVPFEEVRVPEDDDAQWDSLYEKSGMRTMPQIFAHGKLVGGYAELAAQDTKDQLTSLKQEV